jgi:hypothetical protein
MGLPSPGKQRDPEMDSFSHHILKFELSGPECENFSVVDLPGLFRSELPLYPVRACSDKLQSQLQGRLARKTWASSETWLRDTSVIHEALYCQSQGRTPIHTR